MKKNGNKEDGRRPKYSHVFEIIFTVKSDNEGEDVTHTELLRALRKKMVEIEANPSVIDELVGLPYHTFEND